MSKQVNYIEASYEVGVNWSGIQEQVKEKYDIDLTIDMIDTIYAKHAELEITLNNGEVIDLGQGSFMEADYKWPVSFFVSTSDYDELYNGCGQVQLDKDVKQYAQEEKRKQLEGDEQ